MHVDDGLWAGSGDVYERARDKLRSLIHIGEEKRGEFEFLGRRIVQDKNFTIHVQQHEYAQKIQPVYIPAVRRKNPSDRLTPHEVSQYLSLVQQLAWPTRTTLVRHAY